MHHRHLFGVFGDTHAGQHGGDTGADVLTHDDGDGSTVADAAGQCQCLQNTHRGRGALDHCCYCQTHKNAQKGILKGCEKTGESGVIGKGLDRTAHQLHAVH